MAPTVSPVVFLASLPRQQVELRDLTIRSGVKQASSMDEDQEEDILMPEPSNQLTFRLRCKASSTQHQWPSRMLPMIIYPSHNLLTTKVLAAMVAIEVAEVEADREALTSRDGQLAPCSRYPTHKL